MIQSAEDFIRLRTSDDPEKQQLATYADAPVSVWLEVIEKHPDMVKWVIHNKTVPLEVLEKLLKHPDSGIRWWLATKRKLTYEMFDKLSSDEDEYVRRELALNKKIPRNILERLVNDSNSNVSTIAKERLEKSRSQSF